MSIIVPILILALLIYRASQDIRDPFHWAIFAGLRVRHFLLSWGIFAGSTAALYVLLTPDTILRWGWWTALGGKGSIIFGQTTKTSHSASDLLICLAILFFFVFTLCKAALWEERIFRKGDEERCLTSRLRRSVYFGLIHLSMGIPLGAALALSVAGFGFSWMYRHRWKRTRSLKESLLEATRVHIALNLNIAALAAIALVLELWIAK